MPNNWIYGHAEFSTMGHYRWVLHRKLAWGPDDKKILFIMLNPSTVDADTDDPTIRRCVNFAKREGGTSLTIVNLFGLVSTNPKELHSHSDPEGVENMFAVHAALGNSDLIIAAWGAHKLVSKISGMVLNSGKKIMCLGTTKNGAPRHPLYLKSDTPLQLYARRIRAKTEFKRLSVQFKGATCVECAKILGGIPTPWPCTVHSGQCPRCKQQKTLMPWSDFNWPLVGVVAEWD